MSVRRIHTIVTASSSPVISLRMAHRDFDANPRVSTRIVVVDHNVRVQCDVETAETRVPDGLVDRTAGQCGRLLGQNRTMRAPTPSEEVRKNLTLPP